MAHLTNVKYINKHNQKVSPFGIALINNGNYIEEMLVPLTVSFWRINTRLKKYIKKNGQTQSQIENTIKMHKS